MWSTLITAGVSALLLVLMFFYFRYLINKRLSDDSNAERLREEVAELIRDLNQTTERNLIIIEDHVQKLKTLLAESEKSISLLSREADKSRKSKLTYDHLKKKSVTVQPPPVKEKPAEPELFKEPATEEKPKDRKEKKSRRELAGSVIELWRRGTTVEDIADRLDLPTGEVELMISLYGREEQR